MRLCVIVVVAMLASAGCKDPPPPDPRLLGTWDLVVDAENPQRYLRAYLKSGTIVFGKDRMATQTLVVEGETDRGVKTATIETRYRGWHIGKFSDGGSGLGYTDEDGGKSLTRMRVDGPDMTLFIDEIRDDLRFHRRE